jgi:hypothetical protein
MDIDIEQARKIINVARSRWAKIKNRLLTFPLWVDQLWIGQNQFGFMGQSTPSDDFWSESILILADHG